MPYGANTAVEMADAATLWNDGAVQRAEAGTEWCEVITEFSELERLGSQWANLWEADPRAEVFQSPGWSGAWWRAFGGNYELCTIAVFSGNQLEGILPLVRRDKVLQFLGTPEADYADIICREERAPEVLAAALRTLLQAVGGWNECRFQHLSKNARMVRHYRRLPRQLRARLRCVLAERQQTIVLRNQREAVFQSLLGKHHTRRLQNRLRKAGQLQFRYLESEADAQRALPDFFRHHIRRHAALGRASLCARPEFRQFLQFLVSEFLPSGKLRFGVLELDGRPLAWDLGFLLNGKFLLYQHTFDLDIWHYTPGEVLLWNELKYARDHVSREFDFGRGDELYKDRFANHSRETFSMYFEPSGMAGTLRGWRRTAQALFQPGLWKAKEIVKRQRALVRGFRSLRMWMIGAVARMRQAGKQGAVLSCILGEWKQLFDDSVLSRKSTDIFAFDASQIGFANLTRPGLDWEIDLQEARFGDLVDLACQHPEILSPKDLANCRKRLKAGDRVYIVRERSLPVIVCWLASIGTDGAGSEVSETGSCFDFPALVLEESWNDGGRDLSLIYRFLIPFFCTEAVKQNAELLVHCAADQKLLRQDLELSGFRPKFQSTRYKLLGNFRHCSISAYPRNLAQSRSVV
jgi:CelD/BcsL family acetyltransferase involved in cellulose biosynthesis